MDTEFINPLTGEKIPATISALTVTRQQLKEMGKRIEAAIVPIDEQLFELLSIEHNEAYETDNFLVKIVRGSRKVFNLEKALMLLKGQTSYIDEKGKTVDLLAPKAGAVQDYLALKAKRGELSAEESEQYRQSFEKVDISAYVKVDIK